MSRLDELIAELFPNGVEYRKLGDFASISRGGSFQKKDFAEIGTPCIHYGQIYTRYGLFADTTFSFITDEAASKSRFASQNDIVMAVTSENVVDVCKCVAWLGSDDIAISGHTAIIKHDQNPKYLTYYFHSSMFFTQKVKIANGTKVIEVSPNKLKDILIPIPPLAIQEEIVRILDNFTELSNELSDELSNELSAIKKQYDFYLNNLYTFKDNVIWKPLGEEFPFIRNGFVGTVTSHFTDSKNGVRYLKGTNIHNGVISDNDICYVTKEFHKKQIKTELNIDDIIMVQSGHVGDSAVITEAYKGANCHALIVMSNGGKCNSKFINYYFQTNEGKKKLYKITTGGTIKHILASKMKQFLVPLPPINEQNRIVDIIDGINYKYNNLSAALQIEIEARRKQYEYYRDKLLTFQEA